MHKVLVLADPSTAEVFALTDFVIERLTDPRNVPHRLQRAVTQGFDVVFITEDLAEPVQQELRNVQEKTDLVVTVIPGVGTSKMLGERMLSELRKTVAGL